MYVRHDDWHCSRCGKYADPQHLDYDTGLCWPCQDGEKPMKMYILILDDVPIGHAINSAAHASLACYLRFQQTQEMKDWLANSFKKVTCRVSRQELDSAIGFIPEHIVITESNLDGRVMCAAFAPRAEWDSFFKTLALWK